MNKFKIILIIFSFLIFSTTTYASLGLTVDSVTSTGAINLNPTSQPVTVNGDLTITGTINLADKFSVDSEGKVEVIASPSSGYQSGVYAQVNLPTAGGAALYAYNEVNAGVTAAESMGLYVDATGFGAGATLTNNYGIYINSLDGLITSGVNQAINYADKFVVDSRGNLNVDSDFLNDYGAAISVDVTSNNSLYPEGFRSKITNTGVSSGTAGDFEAYSSGSADSEGLNAIYSYVNHASSGTASDLNGIFIDTPVITGGAVTNVIGLKILDQSGATNNWAIKTGAGKVEFGDSKFILTPHTPATSSEACTVGTFNVDSGYVYVCTATNTWKRAALATW